MSALQAALGPMLQLAALENTKVFEALRQDLLVRDASIQTELKGLNSEMGEIKQTTETQFTQMQHQFDSLKLKT